MRQQDSVLKIFGSVLVLSYRRKQSRAHLFMHMGYQTERLSFPWEVFSPFPDCTGIFRPFLLCGMNFSTSTCHLAITLSSKASLVTSELTQRNVFLSLAIKASRGRKIKVWVTVVEMHNRRHINNCMFQSIEMLIRGGGGSRQFCYLASSAFLPFSERYEHRLIVFRDLTLIFLCQVNTHGAVVVRGKSFHHPASQTSSYYRSLEQPPLEAGVCGDSVNNQCCTSKRRAKIRSKIILRVNFEVIGHGFESWWFQCVWTWKRMQKSKEHGSCVVSLDISCRRVNPLRHFTHSDSFDDLYTQNTLNADLRNHARIDSCLSESIYMHY